MSHQPPKLALETLSIRDFRGIESLDLDFRGPDGLANRLVVLGGPNGCGKTTVLEAAILLLDEDYKLPWVARRDDSRRGASRFTLEGQVHDSFSASKVIRRYSSAGRDLNQQPCFILLWYFPSWRTPGLGGPVDVTIGEKRSPRKVTPDRPRSSQRLPSKTTRERLKVVKQRLVILLTAPN